MRAAVQIGYGDPVASLRIQDVPTPNPGSGQVLVRVSGATRNRKDLFALANLADRAFFGTIAVRVGSRGNVVERDNSSLTPAASRER